MVRPEHFHLTFLFFLWNALKRGWLELHCEQLDSTIPLVILKNPAGLPWTLEKNTSYDFELEDLS